MGIDCRSLRGIQAENKDVIRAYRVADFNIRTVEGADGERTVEHKLHVAGAGGLLAGG